jgi:hypothetical protein
MNKVIIRRGR